MDFGHFWCVKVLLESSFKSVALGKSIMGSFSGHLNYLFHKNFLFSSSKPNSCPKQCFSRTNEPNHSTIPRSLVQKVSVQCILGTVNTGCLLSAFWAVVEALTPQRGPVPAISLYLATEFTVTLVYLNSSLNPLLYSWKIPGVKQAVKIIIRQLLCSST